MDSKSPPEPPKLGFPLSCQPVHLHSSIHGVDCGPGVLVLTVPLRRVAGAWVVSPVVAVDAGPVVVASAGDGAVVVAGAVAVALLLSTEVRHPC
jgi:hypothetical protein